MAGPELAALSDGEGFLLRPVMRNMCRYESLKNGAVDLADIACMNEAIDVDDENRMRIAEWSKNGR